MMLADVLLNRANMKVNEVVESLSAAETWFQAQVDDSGRDNSKFLTFAVASTHKVGISLSRKEKLAWASLAVHSYQKFVRFDSSAFTQCKFSEMNMRAMLISQLGCDESEEMLKPSIIFEWFHGECPNVDISLIDCNYNSISLEDLKKLRVVKNMLSVFKPLMTLPSFNCDPIISTLFSRISDFP